MTPMEPNDESIGIKINRNAKKLLGKRAEEKHLKLAQLVRIILLDWIDNQEGKKEEK
jgi:hypothetical protein